ncbi:hypothetical protein [Nocardia transvalensis]|uniref:hypothetical protein n=1 Tax=Nocardia transvalensis TaxID=37333 RepID=UPI001894ECD0|nr:hypothetical protein [Nocardia transvalensis]MBF6333631.1 hypothetical protein [Nocardia transvalensis]
MITTDLHRTDLVRMSLPTPPCPRWCERPDGHGWEDDVGTQDLLRIHRRTIPIAGTDHGSLMLLAIEHRGTAGVERSPTKYVVDTGAAGDCELDAAGAQGLAAALTAARALTTQPP